MALPAVFGDPGDGTLAVVIPATDLQAATNLEDLEALVTDALGR